MGGTVGGIAGGVGLAVVGFLAEMSINKLAAVWKVTPDDFLLEIGSNMIQDIKRITVPAGRAAQRGARAKSYQEQQKQAELQEIIERFRGGNLRQ